MVSQPCSNAGKSSYYNGTADPEFSCSRCPFNILSGFCVERSEIKYPLLRLPVKVDFPQREVSSQCNIEVEGRICSFLKEICGQTEWCLCRSVISVEYGK
jgi:hypothetical protein